MKKIFSLVLMVPIGLALSLVGCDGTSYSDAVQYKVRTDPMVVLDTYAEGQERLYPDRPGQLPIMDVKALLDPLNPLFARSQKDGSPEPDLVKQGKLRDPNMISSTDRAEIKKTLDELFGTPAKPKVQGFDEADKKESPLKLSSDILARGSSLYRIHCLHCHGVTGDGRGPTAQWVNPHPRDYRQAAFKFTSVDQTRKSSPPARRDLTRVLQFGIEATAMPSFVLLPSADLEALVSYVTHLSIRGKTEFETMRQGFKYDKDKNTLEKSIDGDLKTFMVDEIFTTIVSAWEDANKNLIQVSAYPYKDSNEELKKSVLSGQEMFLGQGKLGKDANCVQCHVDYGRQSKFRFDVWGTMAKPNNFTQSIFRGGRRPVDIYYRVHSGIMPSGMAAFGKVLPPEKIWDLVNFVQVVGNPSMRKALDIVID